MSGRASKRQRSSDHSVHLLHRLGLHKKLRKHTGSVNTICFNADGDILVSGSDDMQLILWDWDTATVKLSFDSGHSDSIFRAKFMPFSDDRSIVTSAADGQVRFSKILESGQVETCMLGMHKGRVHNLALEPRSPFSFYTCGHDGSVNHFDLRTRVATNIFTCKEPEFSLVVDLNAIAVDPRNPSLLAVGGMDEYARVYDIRSYRSESCHSITSVAFSDQSELLVSYNDEFIYLFSPDMGIGPSHPSETETVVRRTKTQPQVYKEHTNLETVKGVGFFGPKCEYVVSGSDCGRIFMWRKKDGELLRVMEAADKHVVNCVESHPHMPLMASSGIDTDIKIWTAGGSPELTSPRNAKQALVSRWFMFYDEDDIDHECGYYVDDDVDDDDEEDGDEDDSDRDSSDDDESAEDVDVEIRKDDDVEDRG